MNRLREFLYAWTKDGDIYYAAAEDEFGEEIRFIKALEDFLEEEGYQYQITPLNLVLLDGTEAKDYILVVLNEEKGEPEAWPIHLEE